jgi:hypothetical protein
VAIIDEGIKLRSWSAMVDVWLSLLAPSPYGVSMAGSQSPACIMTTQALQALVAIVTL